MGTLAIRQGDVLFFARSLVWSITMSEKHEDIASLPEAIRYERFLATWERHIKAGEPNTRKEKERIAAMYNVTLTSLKTSQVPTNMETEDEEPLQPLNIYELHDRASADMRARLDEYHGYGRRRN